MKKGEKKSLEERRLDFLKMKEGLFQRFMDGEDPRKIGQILMLVEAIEKKDIGENTPLEGMVDITKKELQEKIVRQMGKKGGQATLKRYGTKQMKEWGKKGGRPKKMI